MSSRIAGKTTVFEPDLLNRNNREDSTATLTDRKITRARNESLSPSVTGLKVPRPIRVPYSPSPAFEKAISSPNFIGDWTSPASTPTFNANKKSTGSRTLHPTPLRPVEEDYASDDELKGIDALDKDLHNMTMDDDMDTLFQIRQEERESGASCMSTLPEIPDYSLDTGFSAIIGERRIVKAAPRKKV